jgi:dephospho-CoA kinase
MLRVGLTGGLASGKSTVAAQLRALGAELIEADELGRVMMEPGQPVFAAIVAHFGDNVVADDGHLDRARLAHLAFAEGRLQELNAIIHPAVLAAQQRWMDAVFEKSPDAVAVVESALIFEVVRDARLRGETTGPLADWRNRLDRVIVVTAPVELRVARYVHRVCPPNATATERAAAEAEARRRLAHQIPDAEKLAEADDVLENTGDAEALREKVTKLWTKLQQERNSFRLPQSLQ